MFSGNCALEASGGAYADLKSQFYDRLQSIYGAPGSASSLEIALRQFHDSAAGADGQPGGLSPARAGVIGAAQALAQQINGVSGQIQRCEAMRNSALRMPSVPRTMPMARIAQINQQTRGAWHERCRLGKPARPA